LHGQPPGPELEASERGDRDTASLVALTHGRLQGVVVRKACEQQSEHGVLIPLRERADRLQQQPNRTFIFDILVRYLSDIADDTGLKVEI
jgi:hypothetical protein